MPAPLAPGYLDYAATTPLRREALEAMAPFYGTDFGNPSGGHRVARRAKAALEEARDQLADLLGARPGEVVFTGSGTEADNLAVLGPLVARRQGGQRPSVVCSAIEHDAVLESCQAAAEEKGGLGAVLRLAPVGAEGIVDLEQLGGLLDDAVDVVSVMAANNELGTRQPLDEVARLVRHLAPRAVLHTDAVQAAPWDDLRPLVAQADLISISAHKFGGPKGVGALVVREGVDLAAVLHGGGQERGRRSGTHNVAGAVAMAAALAAAQRDRLADAQRVTALRDHLADGLLEAVPRSHESAPRANLLPGHCHLRFEGVEQEELLVLLDEDGVCASGGSACASGALEPSHVLVATGLGVAQARSALRLTLGYASTEEDVRLALAAIPRAVERLRG